MLAFPSRAGFGDPRGRREGRSRARRRTPPRSRTTSATSGSSPPVGRAAARTPSRARRCSRTACGPPPRSPAWPRTTPRAWTGRRGWARTTRSSTRPPPVTRTSCSEWMEPHVEAMATIEADEIVAELAVADLGRRRSNRSPERSARTSPPRSARRSATGRGAGSTTTSRSCGDWGFDLARHPRARSPSGRDGRT